MASSDGVSGRLVKGSAWITASRLIVNLLNAVSIIILAANLDTSDFGIVAIATTVTTILATLTDFSLSQALVRQRHLDRDHFDTAFTLNLLRGLVLGAFICSLAWPLAGFYGDHRLTAVLVALGVGTFLGSLANPKEAALTRALIFWQTFAMNVSAKVITFIVSIAIAVIYHSYWALVVGTLIGQVVNVIVSYAVAPHMPRLTLKGARDLLSFSIWLSLSQIVNTLNWRADNLLIGKFLGSSILGQYDVGNNLAMLPTREVVSPLTRTLFPAFSTMTHDKTRLVDAYQRAQSFITALALPIGTGTAIIAGPLVELMMGERWAQAALVVQVLAAVFALQTVGQFAQSLGMALGQNRLLFKRDCQLLAGRLPLVIGGMVFFGLPGLIGARVISGLAGVLLNIFLVRRFLGLGLIAQIHSNRRALIACILMAIVLLATNTILPDPGRKWALGFQIVALILLGGLIYLGATALLWKLAAYPAGPEQEVVALIHKGLNRMSHRFTPVAKGKI